MPSPCVPPISRRPATTPRSWRRPEVCRSGPSRATRRRVRCSRSLPSWASTRGTLRRGVRVWPKSGFDAERRRMTTVHQPRGVRSRQSGQPNWVAVKGALEAVGPCSTMTRRPPLPRPKLVARRFAADGYRVLALADGDATELPSVPEQAESGPAPRRRRGHGRSAACGRSVRHRRRSFRWHHPGHDHRRSPAHGHLDRTSAGCARRRP